MCILLLYCLDKCRLLKLYSNNTDFVNSLLYIKNKLLLRQKQKTTLNVISYNFFSGIRRLLRLCLAYYTLDDPNSNEFRYPSARSSLKTVHWTVFYASDPLWFESLIDDKKTNTHPKGWVFVLAEKEGFEPSNHC